MATTLAFDVYGTLIDTTGVAVALQKHIGERAAAFAALWREKQLEYSFRRGLMRRYDTFTVCTQHALEYACSFFATELSEADKAELMAAYRTLPAFPDVATGLTELHATGLRMYAFSNGPAHDVNQLLQTAGIQKFFQDIVSVDEIKTFKPDPAVYEHFLQRAGASSSDTWLISSNPFDVIGAMAVGMRTAWVQRSEKALFDPWGITPTVTIRDLSELVAAIQS
ncbi:MAG: haloacid dehalogenase type II [Gammaproteobacteria bacterium]|nr:haloacid dehalogenase type II [Gammaproteobacteria bacterium]